MWLTVGSAIACVVLCCVVLCCVVLCCEDANTARMRARRAKSALLSWTRSQMWWKKLQFAVRAGAFSVGIRRQQSATLSDVFVWNSGVSVGEPRHVAISGETPTQIALNRNLLTVMTSAHRLFGTAVKTADDSKKFECFADYLVSCSLGPTPQHTCALLAGTYGLQCADWCIGKRDLVVVSMFTLQLLCKILFVTFGRMVWGCRCRCYPERKG